MVSNARRDGGDRVRGHQPGLSPPSGVEQADGLLLKVLVQVPFRGHAGVNDQDLRVFAGARFDQAKLAPLARVAVGPDYLGGVGKADAPLLLTLFDLPRSLGPYRLGFPSL